MLYFYIIFISNKIYLDHQDKKLFISGNGSLQSEDLKDVIKDQVENVEIEEGIDRLEKKTFSKFTRLKSIVLPESLVFIGSSNFEYTDLRLLNIPSGVTKIESFSYMFYAVYNFKSINANSSNTYYRSYDGCLYNSDFTTLYCVPGAKETVQLHRSLTHIETWAFYANSNKNITIPDTVQTLSYMTFVDGALAPYFTANSSLKVLCTGCFCNTNFGIFYCPPNVETIQQNAFSSTTMTEFKVHLNSSLKTVSSDCFRGSIFLTTITFPNTIESISVGSFNGCPLLNSVIIENGCKYYTTFNNILYNFNKSTLMFIPPSIKNITIPPETTKIASSSLQKCSSIEFFDISSNDNFDYENKIIYDKGFKKALHSLGTLVNVNISSECVTLADSLFEGHFKVETVIINDHPKLKNIGLYCFKNTPSLRIVILPSSVENIYPYCFEDSNIREFRIPKCLKMLQRSSFRRSNITNVTCDPGCVCDTFSNSSFRFCNMLQSITLPDDLTSIESECFKGCTSLASITFPPDLTTISEGAFVECTNLSRIDFEGDNVTTIEKSAFYNCNKLERFECPSKIKELTESVFQKCHCLREFSYPHGSQLDRISNLALSETNLSTFEVPSSVSFIHSGAFKMCNIHTVFHTAEGNLNYSGVSGILYSKDVKILKLFPHGLSECEIDSRCRIIEEGAFSGCSKLETVIFKNYIEVIRSKAFQECSNLRLVRIENNIKEILENSFEKCTRLKDLYIGSEQLIRIGKSSFNGCDNLERVQISKIIKSEEEDKSVRIDGKGESGEEDRKMLQIEPMVFQKCLKLTEVELPNTIEELGSNTFEGCIKLQRIYLPDNLHEISDSLFKGCLNLENVTIPSKVESIQNNAFEGCSKIKYVYYCSSTPSIEGIASMNIFISVPNLKQIEGITLISYPFQNIFGIEAKKIMHRCHVYPTEIFTISVEKNMTDISLFVADIISKDEDNELPH